MVVVVDFTDDCIAEENSDDALANDTANLSISEQNGQNGETELATFALS